MPGCCSASAHSPCSGVGGGGLSNAEDGERNRGFPSPICSMYGIFTMIYHDLPAFGCFLGQILVNIPYMEHMGPMMRNPW